MGVKRDAKVNERKQRRKADSSWWEEIEVKEAEKIPYDIDGTCVFKLSFDPLDRRKSSTDGRSWKKSYTCNTKEYPIGRRKTAKCCGSYTCRNHQCICFMCNMGKKTTYNGRKRLLGHGYASFAMN